MREYGRWMLFHGRRLLRFLVRANGTPHQIALGIAVGFFVGWLPIIGIQMAVALACCSVLRCNPVVPLAPIWLTNPVTFYFIYGANYEFGRLFVGGPPWNTVMKTIFAVMVPPDLTADLWSNPPLWMYAWVVEFFRNLRRSAHSIVTLGAETMVPLWLGSALVGTVLAVLGYYATRAIVTHFRTRFRRKTALSRNS